MSTCDLLSTTLLFSANQGKPLHLSFYLDAWQDTKSPFIITDMSKQTYRYSYYSNNLSSSIHIQVIYSPGRDPWMPHLASPPGIRLPLALNWLCPLITDTIQWVTLSSSPKTPASGGELCFHVGALGHLSTTKPVPFGLNNLFGAFLPHQPEGLERCRKIP